MVIGELTLKSMELNDFHAFWINLRLTGLEGHIKNYTHIHSTQSAKSACLLFLRHVTSI